MDPVELRLDKIERALRDVWRLLKRIRSPFYTARDVESYDRLKSGFEGGKDAGEKKR